MNKLERYKLYAGSASPGWWWILDEYVPQLRTLDPECEIYIKEKFGVLRLRVVSDVPAWDRFIDVEVAAEKESATVCEMCGAPGRIRTERDYIQTLCDRCVALDNDPKKKEQIIEGTKQRWLGEKSK